MGWDIVAIGTNHNLPVEDPVKTAERISSLVDGPISVGYYENWIFNPACNRIESSNENNWIEIKRINSCKPGSAAFFSIEHYCARNIYTAIADIIDKVEFVDNQERDWFLSDATDEPFALYECERLKKPSFYLRILKEIIDFDYDFPGRWFQFVRAMKNPHDKPNEDYILEFRQNIFRQLMTCGCDKAYYFADQGVTALLFDNIDKSATDWVEYLETGDYAEDRNSIIVKVQELLDGRLKFAEEDGIDCFVDDFSDLRKGN